MDTQLWLIIMIFSVFYIITISECLQRQFYFSFAFFNDLNLNPYKKLINNNFYFSLFINTWMEWRSRVGISYENNYIFLVEFIRKPNEIHSSELLFTQVSRKTQLDVINCVVCCWSDVKDGVYFSSLVCAFSYSNNISYSLVPLHSILSLSLFSPHSSYIASCLLFQLMHEWWKCLVEAIELIICILSQISCILS